MTTSPALDDLDRAVAATAALLDPITADQWARPTPCTDWDVRALVAHLVGMNLVLRALFDGEPPPARDGDRLGDDAAGAFRRSAAALAEAAARPGALDREQATRVGTATGLDRLRWRVADLLVHDWDLARALGRPLDLPDDLVGRTLDFVRDRLPGQDRQGRFADPQPVDAHAPAIDRLVAFSGRRVD